MLILQGHDVRAWRERARLTQDQAAELLGIAREHLSRIENGKAPVSASVHLKIQHLQREDRITSVDEQKPKQPSPVPGKRPVSAGSLKAEVLQLVEITLWRAGNDLSRLGWVLHQTREHLSPPKSWLKGDESEQDVHSQVMDRVLREREQAQPAEAQEPDRPAGEAM